jgi:hypothetical protein
VAFDVDHLPRFPADLELLDRVSVVRPGVGDVVGPERRREDEEDDEDEEAEEAERRAVAPQPPPGEPPGTGAGEPRCDLGLGGALKRLAQIPPPT